MKALQVYLMFLLITFTVSAREYYVATDGNDLNEGSISAPFATLAKAQQSVSAGDVVWIRGGIYQPTNDDIMGYEEKLYHTIYLLDKSGTEDAPICYYGYPGERPIFDLSKVKPSTGRISGFYVKGSWLHLRNFEIIGIQIVMSTGNTQSECISNRGGSHNIYENLAMHDGKGIGFYLVKGGDNLVLNCDAYNNYENETGSGTGGNVDGFGFHPALGNTGNVVRGCRAWWNSDDGFDLIHANEAVRIENCWAFYNGYIPGTFKSAADGNGFKAGGYGMDENSKIPEIIPSHSVVGCLAYRNKAGGIYSNHHLGGIYFANNTSYYNRYNYNMVCRKSKDEPVDVSGYGHKLINNLGYDARESNICNIDYSQCTVNNNSFYPTELQLSESDFISLDPAELILPRKDDGSLPEINFLTPKEGTEIFKKKLGHTFADYAGDNENGLLDESNWLLVPTIEVNGDLATILGDSAGRYNKFYINDVSVKLKNGAVDLTSYTGELTLKATSSDGGIIKLITKR